jgi:chromosome segregation ATPase
MTTKLDDAFATLRGLISDQTRDLAIAMAELASVAQQRDKALTERDASRAGYSAMNTRIYGPGGECHELDKARADIAFMDFALEMERINASHARAERDKLNTELSDACRKMDSLACVLDGCRIQRDAATIERDNARQSLRAAEADAAEIDTLCNDFRRANSRLVADLAAAVQRADTAEAILRAKA